jgi:hypothetical protein
MPQYRCDRNRGTIFWVILVVCVASVIVLAGDARYACSQGAAQKTFASPEEAVRALMEAVRTNNLQELAGIFGPDAKNVISSGDDIADRAERDRFVQSFMAANRLVADGTSKTMLHVGKDDWIMPIPLVKKNDRWFFDTKSGNEEIINRRIGHNELNAIQVCFAYVDAQLEYAKADWDSDQVLEYAQKIVSTKGKRDGLYWAPAPDEIESPFGPLVAQAAGEGYKKEKAGSGKAAPYHGYYYKVLKRQGKNAPGGAYSYVINGNMIGGYALVAYPAQYGVSGVMTFIVNQRGAVYQKDLGRNTEKLAGAMTTYNPDRTWKMVE